MPKSRVGKPNGIKQKKISENELKRQQINIRNVGNSARVREGRTDNA